MDAIDRWLRDAARPLSHLDAGDAEILLLGELNHFVHEKSDFRLACANQFAGQGFETFGEELGWSDGTRIDAFLNARDAAIFERISLFGFTGDARSDRDDRPRGIFKASLDDYPVSLMRAEQERFYRGLRAKAFFGFDVAAGHDGTYADLTLLTGTPPRRITGESLAEEILRLEKWRAALPPGADPRIGAAVGARIDGLRYAALVRDAATYEATRPAMAFREDAMKRRFSDARSIFPGRTALMAHAMHLAKDDNLINAPGAVGPGGRLTPSLGHHIVQELGLKAYAVWMIYGGGEDSQPLKDLPNKARFPSHTLNARMARLFDRPTVVSLEGAPDVSYAIGHLYNTLFETRLKAQADAVWFTPKVTPMRLG